MRRKKNIPLLAALRVAGRGIPIFPVYGTKKGKCRCGDPKCDSPGKHPMTPHGVKDATTEEEQIHRWWQLHPHANYGVATGSASRLVVLDIDSKHGGLASLEKLEAEFGHLLDGPRVRTGGGGLHLYFRHPDGTISNRAGILPGVDVRAEGGYVVGPGSLHVSEKPYLWVHGRTLSKLQLPRLSERLLRLLQQRSSTLG